MSEVTPEPRMPVMIVVDVSWADQSGTLQTARARMENRSVSGACIRLKPPIQVDTRLRVHWRWEEFTGVARYCRSDGREHVVGILRDKGKQAILEAPPLTDVSVRDDAQSSEAGVSPAIIESMPKLLENLPSEIALARLKLDAVPVLPIASASAATPPQEIAPTDLTDRNGKNGTISSDGRFAPWAEAQGLPAQGLPAHDLQSLNVGAEAPTPIAPIDEMTSSEAEAREIPHSLQPLEFDALPRTEKETKQPPKEREAGKERKRMRSNWLGMAHKDEKEDTLNENSDTRSNDRSDPVNRAPVAAPHVEHSFADLGEKSAANTTIELSPMEDIYRSAGIMNPRKGYSINKVTEMLHSEHIRGLSKELKRASVLMALDAAGVSVEEVLQDAKVRQEAIDSYETQQRREFEALLARKAEENVQIQAELERVKARYGERLRRNLDGMAREKATFGNWLTMKQRESQSMAEAVELCLKTPASEPASNGIADESLVHASNKPV
jgi:hypothetical protein